MPSADADDSFSGRRVIVCARETGVWQIAAPVVVRRRPTAAAIGEHVQLRGAVNHTAGSADDNVWGRHRNGRVLTNR